MTHSTTKIQTPDGTCPLHIFAPSGTGPSPAVIMYMDAFGMRTALFDIATRIAEHGYFTVLPDLYYRIGSYGPFVAREVVADAQAKDLVFSKLMPSANQANVLSDTRAVLEFLSTQQNVKQNAVGTTGYCMGGGLSLAAAGHFPNRIRAAASFHGGRLATDLPDSPHLLAPKMKARVYVAGAVEDASFPDTMKLALENALENAKVEHRVETYEGCKHGWVPSDHVVYNAEGAERHFKALFNLLDNTLRAN